MVEIITKIINGKPVNRQPILQALKSLEGKEAHIIIKEAKNKRSLQQNRYYFGVVIPAIRSWFLEEHGLPMTAGEVHTYVKSEIWKLTKFIKDPVTGREKELIDSSATLPTKEFEGYMELTRCWAAMQGVQIPLPGEQDGE